MSLREGAAVPVLPSVRTIERLIWGGVILGGLVLIALVTRMQLPLLLLPAIPIALVVGATLMLSTQLGLCFIAFAIAPLGNVQAEVASVTIGLSEAMILALFGKECLRYFLSDDSLPSFTPKWTLCIYLFTSVIGIVTGLRLGNAPSAVLQDFRQFVEYTVLLLLVLWHVRTRRQIVQILFAFVLGGLAVGAHGILQRFTGIGIPGDQLLADKVFHGDVRSGSIYGSTPLGAIMVLTLGPTLGLLMASRHLMTRAFLSAVALTLVASAVFTNTRASWLAIALVLGFMFISVRKSPLLITACVVASLGIGAVLGPTVYERMSKLNVSKSESSLLERINYYTAAWHIFRAHPVTGLGWGCYYDTYAIRMNEGYVAREQVDRPGGASYTEATVHSAYLQILVKSGLINLVAFGAFMLVWAGFVWRERQARPRDDTDHLIFIGIAAALLGYLFHSAFENFFQWPVMSQSYWLLTGLSIAAAGRIVAQGSIDSPAMLESERQ